MFRVTIYIKVTMAAPSLYCEIHDFLKGELPKCIFFKIYQFHHGFFNSVINKEPRVKQAHAIIQYTNIYTLYMLDTRPTDRHAVISTDKSD